MWPAMKKGFAAGVHRDVVSGLPGAVLCAVDTGAGDRSPGGGHRGGPRGSGRDLGDGSDPYRALVHRLCTQHRPGRGPCPLWSLHEQPWQRGWSPPMGPAGRPWRADISPDSFGRWPSTTRAKLSPELPDDRAIYLLQVRWRITSLGRELTTSPSDLQVQAGVGSAKPLPSPLLAFQVFPCRPRPALRRVRDVQGPGVLPGPG